MKSILLTTTAIVAFAGAAAADGHVTMSWSGTATAGIAREGGTDAVAASERSASSVAAGLAAIADEIDTTNEDLIETDDEYLENVFFQADSLVDGDYEGMTDDEALAELRAELAAARADSVAAAALILPSMTDEAEDLADYISAIDEALAILDQTFGGAGAVAAVPTGDFDVYAEINATVVGTVAMENGVTVSAAMSVDAGRGYNFADDDGFDGAKTNGVGFDWVKIDGGAAGTLTIDPNDLKHLVDGDDDESADVMYTNDFGIAKFTMVVDVNEDKDPVAARAVADSVVWVDGETGVDDDGYTDLVAGSAAVAADVQWSAKIEAPVADIATVYAAFDEEGGNVFGGSATIEGITITASSKLEALEEELKEDRSNTVGASYTMGAITVGGEWNSIEDGNQWSINGAYSDGTISLAASTNEGEQWEITGAYALSDNASLEGGVNYTEDAFVGVSFKF